MIALTCDGERIEANQKADHPVGYLDHCGLMDIADDTGLASDLISAIRGSNGTLALSWLHLAEFVRVSDRRHAQNAEDLFARVSPNLFFIEVDPSTVWKRERQIIEGKAVFAPHGDLEFLEAFVGHDVESMDPLSVRNLFVWLASKERANYGNAMRVQIVAKIEKLTKEYALDAEFRKKVDRSAPLDSSASPTQTITLEALSLVLRNNNRQFSINDAMDILHTIVPVAHCDHVLLDRHWANLANQAIRRLAKRGAGFSMAEVLASSGGGVNDFIAAMGRSI